MAKPNYPSAPSYQQPMPRGGRSAPTTPSVLIPQIPDGSYGPSLNPMVDGAPDPGEPKNSPA